MDEELTAPDGRSYPSEFLAAELPEVGRRTPDVRWVSFYFTFPEPLREGAEVIVPVRAKVSADELPEDVPGVVANHVVRVRHVRRT